MPEQSGAEGLTVRWHVLEWTCTPLNGSADAAMRIKGYAWVQPVSAVLRRRVEQVAAALLRRATHLRRLAAMRACSVKTRLIPANA